MSPKPHDELLVRVKALVPTQAGCGVFLTDDETKVIAIFVDHAVATAITVAMHKIKQPRPMTHELLHQVFAGLGVSVEKVVINDLKDETFYARIFLVQSSEIGRSVTEVDARPSDAMAIALRAACPIYVHRHVWERADDMTWALQQAEQQGGGPKEKGQDTPESS